MKKNNKAFSMVELSVVLVATGFLIVMIVKGTALLRNSRVQAAQTLTQASPVAAISNLSLWLETSLKGSITTSNGVSNATDGEKVSRWNDANQQVATKINPAQATTTKMPIFVAEGIGGIPSLRFDGVDDFFRTGTGDVVPMRSGDDTYTMAVVWKYDSAASSATRYLFYQGNNSGVSNRVGALYIGADNNSGFVGANNNYINYLTTRDKPYITIIKVNNDNANNISLFYNSNTAVSGASNSPADLDIDSALIEIGAVSSGTLSQFQGLISEIIIFDRDLKAEEIRQVNDYLSKKYKIGLS
jgi:hypothetical protein